MIEYDTNSKISMKCRYPRDLATFKERGQGIHNYVPCGSCMACRLARVREWTLRLIHELEYHDDSMFLSLTYSDDNYPVDGSLRKSDMQLFLKRLRKRVEPRKIKVFYCGEYGPQTKRAHYHCIVFGYCPPLTDFYLLRYAGDKPVYSSHFLDEVWSLGNVTVGSVTVKSAAYVAGYIRKKLTGNLGKAEYLDNGLVPPFQCQSTGIGLRFLEEHRDRILKDLSVKHLGVEYGLPRYYRKKLGLDRKSNVDNDDFDSAFFRMLDSFSENELDVYEFHLDKAGNVRDAFKSVESSRIQYERNLNSKKNLSGAGL